MLTNIFIVGLVLVIIGSSWGLGLLYNRRHRVESAIEPNSVTEVSLTHTRFIVYGIVDGRQCAVSGPLADVDHIEDVNDPKWLTLLEKSHSIIA